MIQLDCRHYQGRKPCKFKRTCEGCGCYDPIASRILIIKLGALGDLIRTTPVLSGLKKRYPGSQITWLTQKNCLPLLAHLPEIDRLWAIDEFTAARLAIEEFDLLLNFDKETPAVEFAMITKAREKRGFGITPQGALIALNSESEYSLRLGIDDELKFKVNQKTYPELVYEIAELSYPEPPPPYRFELLDSEKQAASEWFRTQVYDRDHHFLLAVNPGCGPVFATKKWLPERYTELLVRAYRDFGIIPVLFGGPSESDQNQRIQQALRREEVPCIRPGENLSLREFAARVGQCDGLISGDTLAMHLALAQKIKTVTLFTSTCAQEIEMYGLGRAIIGRAKCAPCYLSQCKMSCQFCAESITVDEVYRVLIDQLELSRAEELRHCSNL